MIKSYSTLFISVFFIQLSIAQVKTDLDKSVPFWLEYDSANNATLHWIEDDNATSYTLSQLDLQNNALTALETFPGDANMYDLGRLNPGELSTFQMLKNQDGRGVITVGLEMPMVHNRGRCLIAIDEILKIPLQNEIVRLMDDLMMDGWQVDTMSFARTLDSKSVKESFLNWHDDTYALSQSIFLLGHVTVPYSGDAAYDGHNNHEGAWVSDAYYGDVDGAWTDSVIDNTTPSRAINDNIPGDGKFDQSRLPSAIELEIGRVDLSNLPAFSDDEIELTRKYLDKNHAFRTGQKEYPRRAFVDNNFAGFVEGFGQTGWKNFPSLFTADSVSAQDYSVLVDNKYLMSYGCGAGSYTSCGGIGTTQSVWVDRQNQSVFTFLFGSYFGDWDNTNNFLRSALANGDILTNTWAGRPTWHIFPMALGSHIGHCTRLTQNAPDEIFGQGFAFQTAHVSLLGDPTLRLHAMKPIGSLDIKFNEGNVELEWQSSVDAKEGYVIYKRSINEEWIVLKEFHDGLTFTDTCVDSDQSFDYMVKAVRLEHTGSGSYYNTSLGVMKSIDVPVHSELMTFYVDADGDGFGDAEVFVQDCSVPNGYTNNDLDCDDTDSDVFPGAVETCDDKDNNCDGQVDEGLLNTYYVDSDEDGFGDAAQAVKACAVPNGYSDNDLDCDDTNPNTFPGAVETCDDQDNNCDGEIDEGLLSSFYADSDADGFGDATQSIDACTLPSGYADNDSDCDDTDPNVYPGAVEIADNGIDEDCDGVDLITSSTIEILEAQITLSPNPVNDLLYVSSDLNISRYSIMNIQAQKLYASPYQQEAINVSHLSKGVYFLVLELQEGRRVVNKKFVVVK